VSPTAAESCAAALAGLPGMTPRRLTALVSGRDPAAVWDELVTPGARGPLHGRFAGPARTVDPVAVGERYEAAGVRVVLPGSPSYPGRLVGDPGAPAVLFALGDPDRLRNRPSVAIVGTRSATPYGRQVATGLGRDLADAGVVVVSGLARGIDSAAHLGALRSGAADPGRPVAVVGTGADVPYPAATAALWAEVAERGAVLTESALGTPPLPRCFPARNRIIAALAEVVVVVECHHRGGSLYTAEAAARRGIPVGAVPGSVKSRASEGTNGLLVDGCIPVRDAADVLVALSLAGSGKESAQPLARTGTLVAARGHGRAPVETPPAGPGRPGPRSRRSPRPDSPAAAVLGAVEATPTPLETILLRTGLSVGEVAGACAELVAAGSLRSGGGWWSTS